MTPMQHGISSVPRTGCIASLSAQIERLIMPNTSRLSVILFLILLGVGCSKQTPTSRDSDHYVAASQGYLRLHDVEPKDVRYVLNQLAEAKQWERVSNDESGSSGATAQDDFTRATHLYRDADGHDIRVDWAWEKGRDTVMLISTDRVIRESVSAAIGINILRWQQGLPLLTDPARAAPSTAPDERPAVPVEMLP